ncbi:MAG: hypothetical protein ABIL09_12590 [Gemmatimonadota bacterium]
MAADSTFLLLRPRPTQRTYHLVLEPADRPASHWAVPGLPPRPGRAWPAKPLSPRTRRTGWIHTRGRLQLDPGLHLHLRCRTWAAEYRLAPDDDGWHLERLDWPRFDYLLRPVPPMLAAPITALPADGPYLYEVKWDGIRALLTLDQGRLTIRTRHHREVTARFPELVAAARELRTDAACLDGEILCPGPDGRPLRPHVLSRLHTACGRPGGPPVVCYLFDCLYLDGRPLLDEPLTQRRQALAHVLPTPGRFRISPAVTDGEGLWARVQQLDLEGVVAKRPDSRYRPGRREWLKRKLHPD